MLTKIKTIIGVMIMMAASVSVAEQPVLDRVNVLLKEGMSQTVIKLKADGRFLPFAYLMGKSDVNRMAETSNNRAYFAQNMYMEEVNKLMNIAASAAKQDQIVGVLVFGQAEVKVGNLDTKGISVLIEAKGVKSRQLIYPYSLEGEEVKLLNPIEAEYEAIIFKK
jgi:hypothetical protein